MRRPMCWLSVLFLLSVAAFLQIFSVIPQNYDRLPLLQDQTNVTVTGRVDNMTVREDRIVLTLKEVRVPEAYAKPTLNGKYGLLLYFPCDQTASLPQIGSVVTCSGTYFKFQAAENEGQFHTRKYYTCRMIDGYLREPAVLKETKPAPGFQNRLYLLREAIRGIFYEYLEEQDAGIMTALMLGDKGMLSTDIRALYQNAGIAHILSLSGLHVAAIGLGILKLFQAFFRKAFVKTALCSDLTGGGKRSACAAILVSASILLAWCLMTGSATATIRALVMFVLCAIGSLMNRTYDLLSAAAFASIVTVIINPLSICDAGFQLSFGAVISVGLLYPVLQTLLGKYAKNKILQALCVSFSIQTGTLPIVAWHFYQIPVSGIILNLLIVPLLSVVLCLGFLLALLGAVNLGLKWPIFLQMCRIDAFITHVILKFYEESSRAAVSIPGSVRVIGRPKVAQILGFYVFLFIGAAVAGSKGRRREETFQNSVRTVIDQIGRHNTVQQEQIFRIKKALILCAFLIIAHVIVDVKQREVAEVRNLSVGQGDCTLIINSTCVILCDCGSTTKNEVGRYILIPCLKYNGIQQIDDLCISHFDSDHVNGILELLEDPVYCRRIRHILLSAQAPETDGETDNYRRLLELAEDNDIPVYLMKTGDILSDGSMELTCLSPEKGSGTYEDTNAASLVLCIRETRSGFRILLTGDIGEETEKRILSTANSVNACGIRNICCDYLKVAHHGSSSSSSQAFLDAVYDVDDRRARIAVISVGERNSYGHPHEATLQRLSAIPGLTCFRTDLDGEVIVYVTKQGILAGKYDKR